MRMVRQTFKTFEIFRHGTGSNPQFFYSTTNDELVCARDKQNIVCQFMPLLPHLPVLWPARMLV